MIVSNSAGTRNDSEGKEAALLEEATGVEVFRQSTKKPGCGLDVFKHLQKIAKIRVKHPSQVVVVGDRLLTDVVMANTMGSWSIWIKDGVVENSGFVSENNSCHSLISGPYTTPVLESRKEITGFSHPTRLQSPDSKEWLIDSLQRSSRSPCLLPHHNQIARSALQYH